MDNVKRVSLPQQPYLPFRGVVSDTSLYLPLNVAQREIRYVRLHPGLPNNPIACSLGYSTLAQVAHEQTPRVIAYRALSYCWGDLQDTAYIKLCCPPTKTSPTSEPLQSVNYRVTRNLETALRSLRLPDEALTLWIDAMCINQSDSSEKTVQVGLMNLIYSSAADVVVWLGEQDLYSKFVIRCCARLERSRGRAAAWSQHKPQEYVPDYVDQLNEEDMLGLSRGFSREISSDMRIQSLLANMGILRSAFENGDQKLWDYLLEKDSAYIWLLAGLDRLLLRPYFHRIWVYQEILLAAKTSDGHRKVTVRVGQASLRWGDITNLVRFCTRHCRESVAFKNIMEFEDAWGFVGRASEVTFEDYYSRTARFGATDPRDRLFALLHLGSNTKMQVLRNLLLRPDYSLPLESVILNFHRAGLDLRLFVKLKFMSSGQFWNKSLNARQEGQFEFDFQHGVNTRSELEVDMISTSGSDSWPSDPSLGHKLTEVGYSSRANDLPTFKHAERDGEKLVKICRSIFHFFLRFAQPLSLGVSEITFLLGVLTMVGIPEGASRTDWIHFFTTRLDLEPVTEENATTKSHKMKGIARKLIGGKQSSLKPLEPVKNTEIKQDFNSLEEFGRLWSRYQAPQLCITKDGRLLLSHNKIWCGDSIVTLSGCSNPLILTPAESDSGFGTGQWHLKLSGECNFHPIEKVGRRTWRDKAWGLEHEPREIRNLWKSYRFPAKSDIGVWHEWWRDEPTNSVFWQ